MGTLAELKTQNHWVTLMQIEHEEEGWKYWISVLEIESGAETLNVHTPDYLTARDSFTAAVTRSLEDV